MFANLRSQEYQSLWLEINQEYQGGWNKLEKNDVLCKKVWQHFAVFCVGCYELHSWSKKCIESKLKFNNECTHSQS